MSQEEQLTSASESRGRFHQPKHGWMHEFQKKAAGQTPKGTPQSTPRASTAEPHHRPSPRELDAEEEAVMRRTARYGGDDPRDPEEQAYRPESRPNDDGDDSTRVPSSPSSDPSKRVEKKTNANPDDKQDPNEVNWDGPDDPENPQNWSKSRKWFLTVLVSFLTVNVTFASSAPSSGTQQIAMEYRVGTVTATLITSLFLAGYCLGPIIWSTTSELVGRKIIFSISMLMYTLFILGQSLANNIATLMITRFLSGVCAAAPLTNAGGVIADMWDPVGRGFAMSVFSCSVFIGPVMGPIVGGFVAQSYLGWRWIFWVMLMFAGFCWLVTVLFLPETFAPVLLLRKAKRLRRIDPETNKDLFAPHERSDWSFSGVAHRTLLRPFEILAQEPILVLITIYLSFVYGILYGLFEAVPIIFERMRGFNPGESGLIFVAVGLGTTIGGVLNIFVQRKYIRLTPFWKGTPPPEERLIGSMIAGPVLVLGCFWLGWSGNFVAVPWYVPALALIPIGMSFTLVFISLLTYIVDCYLMYAASALAANTIIRSAVGAAFPLFTQQMFTGLGVGWAATLLGFVSLALAPAPYLFYIYGSKIRQKSKFAPALDLQIRKQLEEEGKLPENSLETSSAFKRNGLVEARQAYAAKLESEKTGGRGAEHA